MKEFFKDLETFVEKQWKPLLVILIIGFLLTNYSDIKSGIEDAWGMIIKKKFSSETDLRRFESFYERNINKLSNRDIHGNTVDTKVFEQTSTELLRSSS